VAIIAVLLATYAELRFHEHGAASTPALAAEMNR
jgi:hypothetical protein